MSDDETKVSQNISEHSFMDSQTHPKVDSFRELLNTTSVIAPPPPPHQELKLDRLCFLLERGLSGTTKHDLRLRHTASQRKETYVGKTSGGVANCHASQSTA